MSIQRIASRYAKSLIDLAEERGSLERVMEDIQHFNQVCEVRDFTLLLQSPIVHTSTKRGVFERLFGDSYDTLTLAFLNIILRKGREKYLKDIAADFIRQYRSIKKIAAVSLTTAVALGESQLAAIREKIASAGVTYENVELTTNVDPELLGGFVIEFDDRLYDASVAHKLDQVRKEFS